MRSIPVSVPSVPVNAGKYVNAVMARNWISSVCMDEEVNFIKKLEQGFCRFEDSRYAVGVTSGTSALSLALACLDVGPGDEVIVPDFTMIASVAPIIQRGARPVFIDADKRTWCLDVEFIEDKVTEKTKAILPVHIYGYPADMDPILELAKKYELAVIEDAAEAIGSRYNGKMAGSMGDVGCFSFYANKLITSGEGGMLVTDSTEIYERAILLKDQAFGSQRFVHHDLGYNYRMSNLTAAYAYASLEEVEDSLAKKILLADLYRLYLSGIDGITLPPESMGDTVNSYWMFGLLIDKDIFGATGHEVGGALKKNHGVDTRDFFCPMHQQPVLVERGLVDSHSNFPVSSALRDGGLYLPSTPSLNEDDVRYIVDAIKAIGKQK